jgi:ribosomal protein L44E
MTSVRALANLYCSHCREYVLHAALICRQCNTRNTDSGNPPVPRPPRPYGNQTTRASRARIEGLAARNRARAARAQTLSRIRA